MFIKAPTAAGKKTQDVEESSHGKEIKGGNNKLSSSKKAKKSKKSNKKRSKKMKEKEGKKKAKKNKVSKKAKKLEKRQKRKIKNKKKKNAKKSRRVKSQNSNKIVSQTCTAVRRWKCQCTRLFWKQYLASNFKITSYCCQFNQLPRQYQASL